MKIEKLGKNHRKEVIGGLIVISVIGILAVNLTKAKYQGIEDIKLVEGNINYKPYDFKMMAMYKSDDGTNYTEIDKTPRSNYKINEEKSYCTLNNVDKDNSARIYTDRFGHHVFNNLSKNSKCYIWFDKNTEVVNTVLGNIEVNNYIPDFSEAATTDEGIFEYKGSDYSEGNKPIYYYRGDINNNWLVYGRDNEKYIWWRIIRTNSNGSIRVIYAGTSNSLTVSPNPKSEGTQIGSSSFNSNRSDNMYVGLKYTSGNTHGKTNNSTIIETINKWYEDLINNNKINSTYIDNRAGFCGDRTNNVSTSLAPMVNSGGGIGNIITHYGSKYRNEIKKEPTLSCFNKDDIYNIPVGLITADELAITGAVWLYKNPNHWLNTNQAYWTMSPVSFDYNVNNIAMAYVSAMFENGVLSSNNVKNSWGIRPVINLSSEIKISKGKGTINDPYIVSE